MSHKSNQISYQVVGKSKNHSAGFVFDLDSGELLTGVVTVNEISTSTLTITNKSINTATLSILNNDHIAGQALQCSVTGSVAGTYEMIWECQTDSTPAQTMIIKTTVVVEAI